MQATIVHESRGRMRLRLRQKNISIRQADLLETWLKGQPWTREAVVHERTCCVIVTYTGDREAVLSALGAFTWAGAESSVTLPGHSTRTLNREFQEKLVGKVAVKAATTLFLPAPLRIARIVWHMIPFLPSEYVKEIKSLPVKRQVSVSVPRCRNSTKPQNHCRILEITAIGTYIIRI